MELQEIERTVINGGKVRYILNINGKKRIVDRKSAIVRLKSEGHLKDVDINFFDFSNKQKENHHVDTSQQAQDPDSNGDIHQPEELHQVNQIKCDVQGLHQNMVDGTTNHETSVQFQIHESTHNNDAEFQQQQGTEVPIESKIMLKIQREKEKKDKACENVVCTPKIVPYETLFNSSLKSLDRFKQVNFQQNKSTSSDTTLRAEIGELLNKDDLTAFFIKISETPEMERIFTSKLLYQLKNLSFLPESEVMKQFPPNSQTSCIPTLTKLLTENAPNVAQLLVSMLCKPGDPVTAMEFRKILASFCYLGSLADARLCTFPKVIATELKLCNLTHYGLDLLAEIGMNQTSRQLRRDRDFLSTVSNENLVKSLSTLPFNMVLDNVDITLIEWLEHLTSGIAIRDKMSTKHLSKTRPQIRPENLFTPDFLYLSNTPLMDDYREAFVFILGHKIAEHGGSKGNLKWIKDVLPKTYTHQYSDIAEQKTQWYHAFLLDLQEQKNNDCVQILDNCVDLFLSCLQQHENNADFDHCVKVLKNASDFADEEIEHAEKIVKEKAENFGLPILYGDLLTFAQFRNGKKLRKGSYTCLEKLDLLQLEISIFHMQMAKTNIEFKKLLPDLSNTSDIGTMAYFRARLFKHTISNNAARIKKCGEYEKHAQFFEAIAEEALKSLLAEYFYSDKILPGAEGVSGTTLNPQRNDGESPSIDGRAQGNARIPIRGDGGQDDTDVLSEDDGVKGPFCHHAAWIR